MFALLLGSSMLSYQAYQVFKLYQLNKPLPPIELPKDPRECYHRGPKARLEPPPRTFFWGFSLDWAVDTPQLLVERINFRPGMIKYPLN
jgi:hypothetical protein